MPARPLHGKFCHCLLLTAMQFAPTLASAQSLLTTHRLPAALANEAVAEAVSACAKQGYAITAVVVNVDGARVAQYDELCARAGLDKIRNRIK